MSRKFTQLSEIQESTAIRYINEIPAKYSAGSVVADVPSGGDLVGSTLRGKYILEIPVQTGPVPRSVLDAADKAGVLIRDNLGHTYQ